MDNLKTGFNVLKIDGWNAIDRGDSVNKDLPPFEEYVLLYSEKYGWKRPVIGYLSAINSRGEGFQLEKTKPLFGESTLFYGITHWKELDIPSQ